MGRWAQRRIRGGGPAAPAVTFLCATALSAVADDDTHASVTWDTPVDALSFELGDIMSNPSGAVPISVNQVSPTIVTFQWNVSAAGDTDIDFLDQGGVPVCADQNIAYT